MHTPEALAPALSEEVAERSKRIMSLVDDYVAAQSAMSRAALIKALFNEFHAAAVRDSSCPAPDAP